MVEEVLVTIISAILHSSLLLLSFPLSQQLWLWDTPQAELRNWMECRHVFLMDYLCLSFLSKMLLFTPNYPFYFFSFLRKKYCILSAIQIWLSLLLVLDNFQNPRFSFGHYYNICAGTFEAPWVLFGQFVAGVKLSYTIQAILSSVTVCLH